MNIVLKKAKIVKTLKEKRAEEDKLFIEKRMKKTVITIWLI
jgi:hypothetical protein